MDPNVKQLWLTALRSGEYTQCQSALNTNGSYCCLGVLCEVAVGQGLEVEVTTTAHRVGNGEIYSYKSYNGETGTLPTVVKEWAGLPNVNPITTEKVAVYRQTLAELNDQGHTFAQIADIIERDF